MENIILNLPINKSDKLLVGVSGGADSMALLDMFIKAREQKDFKLHAIHVNHNIRGKESLRDENFVKDYCTKFNVPLSVYSINCLKEQDKTKESLEEVARRMRYDCFFKEMNKIKANYLVLAHHKNDQAETVLFNLVRGSGTVGAAGIKQKDKIIRPFLDYSRQEIEEYVKLNKLKHITDSSNDDINYSRNYLRKVVLPSLEKLCPRVQDNLCAFAKILQEDESYFESILPKNKVKVEDNCVEIEKNVLNEPRAISIRTIKYGLNQLGYTVDLGKVHYENILNLKLLNNGSKIDLPHNLQASVEYDKIVISKKTKPINKEYVKFEIGKCEFLGLEICSELIKDEEVDFNSTDKFIDYDKIPSNAVFRTRREGDVFSKLGSGSKKLNDYLTDKKIPLRMRDKIVLLASENVVLCVLGFDISERVKIDSQTERILKLSYTKK